ncbi:MAG: hypothetical protein [Bacteriophage sp.]|nr:MAG: hypothetical protein [Bacteriophage sp.]
MQELKDHYLNSFIKYLELLEIDTSNLNARYKSDGKMYFDDPNLNKLLGHFSLIFKSSFEYGRGIGFMQGYDSGKKEAIDLMKVKITNVVADIQF